MNNDNQWRDVQPHERDTLAQRPCAVCGDPVYLDTRVPLDQVRSTRGHLTAWGKGTRTDTDG